MGHGDRQDADAGGRLTRVPRRRSKAAHPSATATASDIAAVRSDLAALHADVRAPGECMAMLLEAMTTKPRLKVMGMG